VCLTCNSFQVRRALVLINLDMFPLARPGFIANYFSFIFTATRTLLPPTEAPVASRRELPCLDLSQLQIPPFRNASKATAKTHWTRIPPRKPHQVPRRASSFPLTRAEIVQRARMNKASLKARAATRKKGDKVKVRGNILAIISSADSRSFSLNGIRLRVLLGRRKVI
jgi:hypothetical protein